LEDLGLVQLSQPKINQQELVALDRVQKIAGFDIAMDNCVAVHVMQCGE
jgi:hypothetical protein